MIEEISEMRIGIEYRKEFKWGRFSIVPTITIIDGGFCPHTDIFAGEGNWHITFDGNGGSSRISCPRRTREEAEKWVRERLSEIEQAYEEVTTNRHVILPEPREFVIKGNETSFTHALPTE